MMRLLIMVRLFSVIGQKHKFSTSVTVGSYIKSGCNDIQHIMKLPSFQSSCQKQILNVLAVRFELNIVSPLQLLQNLLKRCFMKLQIPLGPSQKEIFIIYLCLRELFLFRPVDSHLLLRKLHSVNPFSSSSKKHFPAIYNDSGLLIFRI